MFEPIEISENSQADEELEKRRAMVKSLKGCLASYEIDLDEVRDERIGKRGLLNG